MKKILGIFTVLCVLLYAGSVYAGDEDRCIASSPSGDAKLAVDNDISTYYEAENGYVQLDFLSACEVEKIGIRFYDSINTKYTYSVAVSENGSDYNYVSENAVSEYRTYYQLADISRRVLSIRIYGNKISEIEVNPVIEKEVIVPTGINESFSVDTNRISIMPRDAVNTKYAEAALFLSHPDINIMPCTADGNFNVSEPVTSAELSNILCAVTGLKSEKRDLDENAVWSSSTDIKEHADVLLARGGSGVSPNELYKVIVLMMGYEQSAIKGGGYPSGYTKAFIEMKTGAGIISSNDDVTRGDAALAIYKALGTEVKDYVSIDSETIIKDKTSKTGFEKFLDVKKIKNRIDDVPHLKTGSENVYQVSIGGSLYSDNYRLTSVYYGCETELLYKETESGESIVGIKLPRNIRTVYVKGTDIDSVSGTYSVSCSEGGKTRTVKLSDTPKCIYNEAVKSFDVSDLSLKNGSVLFTDCDGDGTYDVVKINSFYDAVVSSVTKDEIYFSEGAQKYIDLSDVDGGTEIYRNGDKTVLSALRPGDVVSIYEAKDKSYYRIEASGVRVEGTLTSSDMENGRSRALLNGEWFFVSDCYTDNHELKLGEAASFGINPEGDLVSKKVFVQNGKNYGVILNAIYSDEDEFTVVKILTANGTVQNFYTTEKVILNGVRKDRDKLIKNTAGDTGDYIWDASGNESKWLGRKLICYTLNDSKEITRIETAAQKGSILKEKKIITPTIYPDGVRYLDGFFADWDEEAFRKRIYQEKSNYSDNVSEPEVISNGDRLVMLGERGARQINRGVIASSYAGLLKNGPGWNDGSNIDYPMNDSTVLFIIPEAGTGEYTIDESLYGITDYNTVNKMGYVQMYNTDGDTYANYVIFESQMSYKPTETTGFLALVTDVKKTVDADNEIRIELTCTVQSKQVKYLLENEEVLNSKHAYYMPHDTVIEKASDLTGVDQTSYETIYDTLPKREIKKGDVIWVGNEFGGYVKGVKVVFDAELMEEKKKEYKETYGDPERAYTSVYTTLESKCTFYNGGSYFGADAYLAYGKVLKKSNDGKYVWIKTNVRYFVDSSYKTLVTRPNMIFPISVDKLDQNSMIYEMDMTDGSVNLRSLGDINIGEEIFVRSFNTYQSREIIVYKWE